MRQAIKELLRSVPYGVVLLDRIETARKSRFLQREANKRLDEFAVHAGGLVLDLGANVGEFSKLCLARGAHVIAYEPDPSCYEKLLQIKNRYPNFDPRNAAVGKQAGIAKLYLHPKYKENNIRYSESSSLLANKTNIGSDWVEVVTEDIETILSSSEFFDFIKIDIEGSEYDIYPSIIKNRQKIAKVLMETHLNSLPSHADTHKHMIEEIKRHGLEGTILLDWI